MFCPRSSDLIHLIAKILYPLPTSPYFPNSRKPLFYSVSVSLNFFFRFHMQVIPCGICFSLLGLFHLAESPQGLSLSQMAELISFSRLNNFPLYICIPHLLSPSCIDGHLSYFHMLAIMNKAARKVGLQITLWNPLLFLLNVYLEMELLHHMALFFNK